MNTIESSVTKLLVSTKHLLEGLTQWSQNKATEVEVSDAYVKLGGDFKVACRAFANQGVDVSDLGDVPHQLRVILEEALCEQPSRETLDRFLPQIRQLIVNLLKNLKKKQGLVQTLANKRSIIQYPGTPPPRYDTVQPSPQKQPDPQQDFSRKQSSATISLPTNIGSSANHNNLQKSNAADTSPKFQQNTRFSSSKYPQETLPRQRIELYRALSEGNTSNNSSTTKVNQQPQQMRTSSAAPQLSETIVKNNLGISPSIQVVPSVQSPHAIITDLPSVSVNEIISPELEALKQLQNGDILKRRASKRFSAYQYAKLTKQSEIPLPKDINKEEASAVPGAPQLNKNGSTLTPTTSNYQNTNTLAIPEEEPYTVKDIQQQQQSIQLPTNIIGQNQPIMPNNKADISFISNSSMINPDESINTTIESTDTVVKKSTSSQNLNDNYYIYLRYNNRTKKAKMESSLTFNSLRLLFIEKFAYTPSGDNFPEIFVQSSMNEIPYELEDDINFMNEVSKDGYIFSLNINNIGNLESMFKDLDAKVATLKSLFESLQDGFNKESLADIIKDSVKDIIKSELRNISNISKPADDNNGMIKRGLPGNKAKKFSDGFDLAAIKKELNTIKKINNDCKKDYVNTIQALLTQVNEFKKNALETSVSVNREHMQNCHDKLSEDSDVILTNVDDLQDMMEALRKDVAQHGSRPAESQLTSIKKEIKDAETAIETMHDYIIHEKPTWKSIWEKELDVVCEEQQFFKLQEDLVDDLKEDLEKVMETFTLVEHVAKEHEKKLKGSLNGNGQGNPLVNFKQPILPLLEPGTSLNQVKSAVLNEVTSIIPNHEDRLNAIAKTERLRQFEIKNISNTKNKFEKELNSFVEDLKFNSTGGIEEVERARQLKDEENLKGIFGVF